MIHEDSGPRERLTFEGSFNRFAEHAMLFVPPARSVEARQHSLFSQAQSRLTLHSFSKERMIAIPLLGPIEWLQEQLSTRHCLEELFTLGAPGHGITEGSGQATEHARVQQKGLEWFRLGIEHFGDEELHHMPVAAGKCRQKVLDLLLGPLPLERKGHQAQPGHPPLYLRVEVQHDFWRKRKRLDLPEKGLGLFL